MSKVYEGNLDIREAGTYDYTEVTGSVRVYGVEVSLPVCTTVGGDVFAHYLASVSLPACTTVGGDVFAHYLASVSLPACTTVGGFVSAYDSGAVSLPVCTTVGGYVFAYGSGAVSLPACTTVGGSVSASDSGSVSLQALKHQANPDALHAALAAQGLALHDGILSRVIRQRGPVTVVQRIGSPERSYVVTDGTHTAHGRTLAEARADLALKAGQRDTSAFRQWDRTTKRSVADLVLAYRAITGACRMGVEDFLAHAGIGARKRLSVDEAIAATKGQYGHDDFCEFPWAMGRQA